MRIVAATLAASLLTACTPPTVEQQIVEAGKLQQKGETEAAAITLKNVLQSEPANPDARLLLGRIFRQNGQPPAAEHHFRAALKANADPNIVLPLLVQALFEQAEFRKVIDTTRVSDYGEAAQLPEVLSYKGHAELSLGQLDEAAASFEESLKRKPEHAPALLGQARLAVFRKDARRAVELVDRALAGDPSSIDAWLIKGDLERAVGSAEGALAAYQKAISLKPAGLAANLNLASMYLERGQLEAARKHVNTILRVAPETPAGYYLLGLIEFQNRNYAAAGQALEQVLKSAPGYLPAGALSGIVAYASGANAVAEQRLADAIARYPRSVYLRKLYAASLLKSGKVAQASTILEEMLKVVPDDPGVLALYGECKYRSHDITAARKYFERALKVNPQNPGLRANLGLARLAAGETERALADLEAAVDLGGASAEGYLVRTLISLGQYDRALRAAARLEATRPQDPVTYNLKGSALFALGDMVRARRAFEHALELDPLQVAAAVNLAQVDRRENNPGAARKRFEKILELDRENIAAMLALSNFAASTGETAEALSWAKAAAQVSPKAYAPALAVARLHFAGNDFANAAPAARIAADASPGNAEVLNMLGYSQLRIGQRAQALSTYLSLVTRHPDSAEAHYGLAGAQIADGQYFPAERSLKKALELRQNFPEAIYSLSGVQLRMGKVADAGRLATDTQKRLPKSSLGFIMAGDVATAEKRFDPAILAYQAAYSLEKSRTILLRLLDSLRVAGKTADIETLASEWLKANPDDVDVRHAAAHSAIRSGDLQAAAEHYRHVLRKQPAALPVLHNLGWVYERLNDPRAMDVAETAYRISPGNAGALHDLGRLSLERGDSARAIELLEKALLVAPESSQVRYQLARAYVATGDNARARSELGRLLRNQEEFPERTPARELLEKLRK